MTYMCDGLSLVLKLKLCYKGMLLRLLFPQTFNASPSLHIFVNLILSLLCI